MSHEIMFAIIGLATLFFLDSEGRNMMAELLLKENKKIENMIYKIRVLYLFLYNNNML